MHIPGTENDIGKSTMNESMYFLLKHGLFSGFQGFPHLCRVLKI